MSEVVAGKPLSYAKWDSWEKEVEAEEELSRSQFELSDGPGCVSPEDRRHIDVTATSCTTTPTIGAVVQIDKLRTARQYNGKKGIVVSGRICENERIAVQLYDEGAWGKTLQIRPSNLTDCTLEKVPFETILKGRAGLVFKGNGELWVGDSLASSVALGENSTRLFSSTADLDKAIAANPWIRLDKIVCCCVEMKGQLRLEDKPTERIDEKWEKVLRTIKADLAAGKKVLVHCVEGRSRSVAIALAAMAREGMPLAAAWAAMLEARPKARPIIAFVVALLRFHGPSEPRDLASLAIGMGATLPKVETFLAKHVKTADDKTRNYINDVLLPALLHGEGGGRGVDEDAAASAAVAAAAAADKPPPFPPLA